MKKVISGLLCLTQVMGISIVTYSPGAWAVLGQGGAGVNGTTSQLDTSMVNVNALSATAPSCSSICNIATADFLGDQWCANHGLQTNSAVATNNPTQIYTTNSNPNGCNVTLYDGDQNMTCGQVNDAMTACKFQNSQLIPQCTAYTTATNAAQKFEAPILYLDLATTAVCATACAATVGSLGTAGFVSGAEHLCSYASMGAGLAEIYQTSQQKSSGSELAHALQYTMAAAPALAGAMNITKSGIGAWASNSGVQTVDANGKVISSNPANGTSMGEGTTSTTTSGIAGTPATEGGLVQNPTTGQWEVQPASPGTPGTPGTTTESANSTQATNGQKVLACGTAALFAIMTEMRQKSMKEEENAQQNACNAVQSLYSQATAASTQAGGAPLASNNIPTNTTTLGTGSSSLTGGSSNPLLGTQNPSNPTGQVLPPCPQAVNGPSGPTYPYACANYAQATDGGLLTNSGLGQALTPLANQLAQTIPPGSASGMIAQALGGKAGDFGNSLSGLAKATDEDSKLLAGSFKSGDVAGATMLASGGGGAKQESGTSMLASLFGGGGSAASAAGTSGVSTFNRAPAGDDVFHTGTHQNLFEIISGKIGQVTSRVLKQ